MQAFHTAGLPPSNGSTIFPTIGWTMNNSEALTKRVAANKKGTAKLQGVSSQVLGYNKM
jgi:hypothetical protein